MRELVRIFQALLNKGRRQLADLVLVMPVEQWALNVTYRKRDQACAYPVIFERELAMQFATLAGQGADEWTVEMLAPERGQTLVGDYTRQSSSTSAPTALEQGRR